MLNKVLPSLFVAAAVLGLTGLLMAPSSPALAAKSDSKSEAKSGAVNVDQVRSQWAGMRKTYQDSIAPYAGQPEHAALLKEYNATLDDTGKALEEYIALKQSTPAAPPATLTPAVDKLINNLTRLKSLQGKASGKLITVLGDALKQQQQITQNAIKNMR